MGFVTTRSSTLRLLQSLCCFSVYLKEERDLISVFLQRERLGTLLQPARVNLIGPDRLKVSSTVARERSGVISHSCGASAPLSELRLTSV